MPNNDNFGEFDPRDLKYSLREEDLPPREKIGKFIEERIPDEDSISKRDVLRTSLRVHDIALQRVEEFLYQVGTIKDGNAQNVKIALKEIFSMNEKLMAELNDQVQKAKRDLENSVGRQREDLQKMLVDHLDTVNQTLNSRLNYHLEETQRITQSSRKDLEKILNTTVNNMQVMFNSNNAFMKDQIKRMNDELPTKAELEVFKHVDKLTSEATHMKDSLDRYHSETIKAVEKFQVDTRVRMAEMQSKYEKVLAKFRLLSKEFGA